MTAPPRRAPSAAELARYARPETRLRKLREAGVEMLDRTLLACVLGVQPKTIDRGRARAAHGQGRMVEPTGYFGRTPWWSADVAAQLIETRGMPWDRHPRAET